MEKKDFQSSITAKISAGEAIKRIGNVAEWWGVTFIGKSGKLNDKFVVKMGGESFFNITVAELIPGKKIVWVITDCNMPWYSDKKEWADTKLIFDLCENNGITTLNFTHEGLTPDIECYQDCETGWTHWIRKSLFSYFTTGKGDFNKPGKIQKIKDQTCSVTIEVAKSPDEVFNHVIELSKWWPEEFAGESI